MNKEKIEEILMAGLSRFNTDLLASYIGSDQKLFDDLINIMVHAKSPLPQRAAWAVATIADKHPWLLDPHVSTVIDLLPTVTHWGIQRSILHVFQYREVPDDKLGEMYEVCYKFLDNNKVPVAVRVFAMQVMFNISIKEPDLQGELKLLIESHMNTGSAGYRSRANKILDKLK